MGGCSTPRWTNVQRHSVCRLFPRGCAALSRMPLDICPTLTRSPIRSPAHPPAHPLTRSPTHRPLKNWRRGRAGARQKMGEKKTPHLSVGGLSCGGTTCELSPLRLGKPRLLRQPGTSISPARPFGFGRRFSECRAESHPRTQPSRVLPSP